MFATTCCGKAQQTQAQQAQGDRFRDFSSFEDQLACEGVLRAAKSKSPRVVVATNRKQAGGRIEFRQRGAVQNNINELVVL